MLKPLVNRFSATLQGQRHLVPVDAGWSGHTRSLASQPRSRLSVACTGVTLVAPRAAGLECRHYDTLTFSSEPRCLVKLKVD